MKSARLPALLGSVFLLTQCGPESMLNPAQEVSAQPVIPVGPETSMVNDLRGSMLTFTDSTGENIYRLSKLGTYTFTNFSKGKSTVERQGLYVYQKTGRRTGRIIFDLKETWNLTFISPHRATAKKEGTKITRTFELEWQ